MATHEYKAEVEWSGGREGAGQVVAKGSGATISLGVPPEFGGPGAANASNPEELLTSSIASCYTMTLGIIAANRKLPIKRLTTEVVGEVEQQGASFVYKRVTIRPTVTLDASASDEQVKMAEEMAHKADAYCIVTNALRGKVEVGVEPTVQRG